MFLIIKIKLNTVYNIIGSRKMRGNFILRERNPLKLLTASSSSGISLFGSAPRLKKTLRMRKSYKIAIRRPQQAMETTSRRPTLVTLTGTTRARTHSRQPQPPTKTPTRSRCRSDDVLCPRRTRTLF